MSDRLFFTSAPDDHAAIEELSRVALRASLDVVSHSTLPEGSIGTVVSVYGKGRAYAVEFTRPFHALVTLDAEQVVAIPGATRADFDATSGDVLRRGRQA